MIIRVSIDKRNILVVTGNPDAAGTADPAYGYHFDLSGSRECTVGEIWTNAASDSAYTRTGYMLSETTEAGVTTYTYGTDASVTYAHTPGNHATLTWLFRCEYKFGMLSAIGSVAPASEWWAVVNDIVTYTAHPAEGFKFSRWRGDVPDCVDVSQSVISFHADRPRVIEPVFMPSRDAVFYVSTTGDNSKDGLCWDTAFKTIKHSVDIANLVEGTAIVNVAEGTYTENVQADITNAVTLISVDGAADTTLKQTIGTRHSIVQLGHPGCRVEGFTFSGHTTTNGKYDPICGAVKITSKGGTLANCVLKNNSASTYYARGTAVMLYGGVMDSCVVVSNTSDNSHAPVYIHGGSAPVEMRNCLVAHNRNSADAVYIDGDCKFRTLISNCTIANNKASAGKTDYDGLRIRSQSVNANVNYVTNVVVENTIICNNLCSGGTISYGYPNWMVGNAAMTNQFRNCLAAVSPNSTCITDEPQFVDPDSLDFSVYPSSPAVDAGVANGNVRDLPGLARPSGSDIDIGAFEYDQSRFSTSFSANEQYALAGSQLTLTSATFGGTPGHLAYSWNVTNTATGEVFTGNEANFTIAAPAAGLYVATLTVTDSSVSPAATASFTNSEPVSRSLATMYVTPDNEANEQFPYDTPAKGAAKLTSAYKHAIDGTTLMLEPGVHTLTVQFIIRKGVRFIGHGENRPAIIKQTTKEERVLYIDHKDAYFENLAVTGGRKGSNGSYGGEIPNARDQFGCGICMNAGGTFFNCSITNNSYIEYYVYGGGIGMKAGRIDRCLIADNSITSGGGSTYFGSGVYLTGGIVENSIIIRNHTRYYGAVAINGANAVVRNCTIYGNDALNSTFAGLYYQSGTVINCAVYNNTNVDGGSNFAPSSSFSSTKIMNCASAEGFGTNAVVCADALFNNTATWDFSFSYNSKLYNAGMIYDGATTALDYLGNPRLSDRRPDIGAIECQKSPATVIICGKKDH